MKKFSLVLVLGALAWVLPCGNAEAIPLFNMKFQERYAGEKANADFAKLVKDTAKCNVCHVEGEKKTVRNAYGEALHDAGLDKKKYPKERVESEAEAVGKEITAAFDKAEAAKSPSGKTFGELIKAGKLPGAK